MTGTRRSGTARLMWLDLARGFGVVSMVIAHTAPWDGVFVGTEYLTAPWFALLIGISLLAWEKTDARAWVFILSNLFRGVVLIAVGEWLQRVYWQIDIVLQTLGLLTIALAPLVVLVGRRRWVWAGISLAVVVTSPLLRDAARDWLAVGGWSAGWVGQAVDLGFAGRHYRVTTFVAIAAAGMAAEPSLLGGRGVGKRGLLVSGALLAGAAVVYAGGRLSPIGEDPYSGTWPEIVGAILLTLSATWFCVWLVDALGERRVRRWMGAVVDTGRMAFTPTRAGLGHRSHRDRVVCRSAGTLGRHAGRHRPLPRGELCVAAVLPDRVARVGAAAALPGRVLAGWS